MTHALVTSGGASHGAWQLGYALRLSELDPTFNPDIFSGTSVGGLFAAFAAMNPDFGQAMVEYDQLWKDEVEETKDIYKTWWPSWLGPFAHVPALWKGSAFNAEPLQKLIQRRFDPERVKLSGKRLILTSVDLLSGELRLHTQRTIIDWKPVYATAAYPLGFDMQVLDEGLHTDGGAREIAPLKPAIDAGATRIDVLVTAPRDMPRWVDDESVLRLLQRGLRVLNILADEILDNDIRTCLEVNRKVLSGVDQRHRFIDLRIHRPRAPLHESALNFNREVWEVNYERGKADADLDFRPLR